jgi:hypothetical protein
MGENKHEIDTINAPEVLVLVLELLNEVVHEVVVEIITTQVSVTGGSHDLEDTLLNGQETSKVPPPTRRSKTEVVRDRDIQ